MRGELPPPLGGIAQLATAAAALLCTWRGLHAGSPSVGTYQWLRQRAIAEILLEMGENIWRILELYLEVYLHPQENNSVFN